MRQWTEKVGNPGRHLLLWSLLCVCACVPQQEIKPVSPAWEPMPLGNVDEHAWTANNRYDIVAPIVAGQQTAEQAAKRAGVSTEQVQLWHDLFLSHGRAGLITPQRPVVKELTSGLVGTWVLVSRTAHGKRADARALMTIRQTGTGAGATMDMLIRENGTLQAMVSHTGDNRAYAISAYFTMNVGLTNVGAPATRLFDVKSADDVAMRAVAPEQATGVGTAFQGQIVGTYWPYRAGATIRSTNTFVKFGESYATANGTHAEVMVQNPEKAGEPQGKPEAGATPQTAAIPDFDWNYIHGMGDTVIYGSTRLDIFDTYKKVSNSATVTMNGREVEDLAQYWEAAKRDQKLLAPDEGEMNKALQVIAAKFAAMREK